MRSIPAYLIRAVAWLACYRWVRGGAIAAVMLSLGCSVGIRPSLSVHEPTVSTASAVDVVGNGETNTQVTPDATGGVVDITGGITAETNLFHRFDSFNLGSGETARFVTDVDIQNVLGQITGGLSTIDGQISIIESLTQASGSANLYLINPAGILFGENVQLNLAGDFTATTATLLDFDGETFKPGADTSSQSYGEFVGEPTGFIFNGSGPIANLGLLEVAGGKIISLLGSNVLNLGEIKASGGGIRLAAIEDGTMVRINQGDRLLSLEIAVDETEPRVLLPTTVAALLTGEDPNIANYLTEVDGEVRLTTDLGIEVMIPDDANSAIAAGSLSVANYSDGKGGTIDLFGTQVGVLGGELDASGQQGGTIRVGGEYSQRATENIYVDDRSSLLATGGLTLISGGIIRDVGDSDGAIGDGGEIIFRERSADIDGNSVLSAENYVNQIYGELDVQSLAPEGSGGTVRLSGANGATLYLAETYLSALSGQEGSITFEASDIEIRDVQSLQNYKNGTNSLFGKPEDLMLLGDADASNLDLFILPQATLASFKNVNVFSSDNIVLTDLMDSELRFPENSKVRFWSSWNNSGDGNFEMTGTAHTLALPQGSVEILSGRIGSLLLRNISTRPEDSGIDDGENGLEGTRNRVQLVSNKIEFNGGLTGDGYGSIDTERLSIRPLGNDSNGRIRDVQIGGDDFSTVEDGPLYLPGNITDVLPGTSSRLKIGGGTTGSIFFEEDTSFYHSVNLRSQGTIDAEGYTIRAHGNATLELTALGNIVADDINIFGNGSVDIHSQTGSMELGEVTISPNESVAGSILLGSPEGNISTGKIAIESRAGDTGGDITIEANNRVFVDSGLETSIRTGSGRVDIEYGADAPFSVGGENRSNRPNGTTGAISNDEHELRDREITAPYDEKDIAITPLSEVSENSGSDEPVSNVESSIPVERAVSGESKKEQLALVSRVGQTDNSASRFANPTAQRSERAIATSLFSQLERRTTSQFQEYLEIANTASVATLEEVQDVLSQVSQTSTEKPALIYVYYVPGAEYEDAVMTSDDAQSRADDQLEVLLVTAEGLPIRKRQWGVSRAQVDRAAAELRLEATSQFSMPGDYLPSAQQLFQWLIAPIEGEVKGQGITSLAFIMDDGLRTLPIAALHNGQNFLIEDYSLGLMPTFSLTDFGLGGDLNEVATPQILAMGASRFKEQPPLPAVESELSLISEGLGRGESFLNEDFTLDNLRSQVASEQYDVLHLATHAVFESGEMDRSYIQLWDDRLNLSEVGSIGLSQAEIDLIILSACSTALGDRNSEYGFAGFAVNAGSRSALASLWPVSDEGTLGFMTQFYQYLPDAEIRADALRFAQLNMLRGQVGINRGQIYGPGSEVVATIPELTESGSWDFSHPFYWSAFTLIGSPW